MINPEIKIPLSKTKILLLTLGAIGFVVACFFILNLDENKIQGNAIFGKIIATSGIIFFGAAGLVGIRKLFDFRIGLTFNEEGIIDNASALSVGLIKWEDIISFRTIEIQSSKMLLIKVKNPEVYIKKGKTAIQRKLMRANHKLYGTPLFIPSNSLKIKFKDLEKTVEEQWKAYQNSI